MKIGHLGMFLGSEYCPTYHIKFYSISSSESRDRFFIFDPTRNFAHLPPNSPINNSF